MPPPNLAREPASGISAGFQPMNAMANAKANSVPRKRNLEIVMIAENDPAGTAGLFRAALHRHTPHRCRLITWQRRYVCDFPADLHLADLPVGEWTRIGQILRRADVWHFHMLADESLTLGPHALQEILAACAANPPAIVRHHHGHPQFRANLAAFRHKYENLFPRDVLLVSTPDMLDLFAPGRATWLPNCVPLDSPDYAATSASEWAARAGKPLRVCQSPTRRNIKSTDMLERVIAELRADGFAIEFDLIEREPHREVMRRRRLADVVFDQMDFSFGISSLEGLALGKPVVCGLSEICQARIAEFAMRFVNEFTAKNLPWLVVNSEIELRDRLAELAADASVGREKLKSIGHRSREFMERAWPEQRIVAMLESAYEAALVAK